MGNRNSAKVNISKANSAAEASFEQNKDKINFVNEDKTEVGNKANVSTKILESAEKVDVGEEPKSSPVHSSKTEDDSPKV